MTGLPDIRYTKTGGGDGNRTHVRSIANVKRYMFSF